MAWANLMEQDIVWGLIEQWLKMLYKLYFAYKGRSIYTHMHLLYHREMTKDGRCKPIVFSNIFELE